MKSVLSSRTFLSSSLSLAAVLSLVAACSDTPTMVVTVRARPAVAGAASLTIELKNGAGLAGDTFELRDRTFPVTFSISSPGRNGELEIKVSARDKDNLLVGRGASLVDIASDTAEVLVDSADFVVNTNVADDQYLTNDFEAVGAQLGSGPTGEWTVTFREDCTAAGCNLFARRYNLLGLPVTSALAAGTNAFAVNTGRVGVATSPAIARGVEKSLAFWETVDTSNATDGVACRALDATGAATNERKLVTEPSTDVVVATPLFNGSFAVTWSGRTVVTDRSALRTLVVGDDCAPRGGVQAVNTMAPAAGARQSSMAASQEGYVVVWHADGGVRARFFNLQGVPTAAAETQLLTPEVGEQLSVVRVTAYEGGFALVVMRTAAASNSLRLVRFAAGPTQVPSLLGSAAIIVERLDSAFVGFSVASHARGPILATWEGCGEAGDGEGCGVFGRLYGLDGVARGEPFIIPTTTAKNQENPSVTALSVDNGTAMFVAAWNDGSNAAPDTSGSSVRARLLYFPE